MKAQRYLLTDVKTVNGERFGGLQHETFRNVKEATFVNAETYEAITLTNKKEILKYKTKLLDKCVWNRCEIALRQCVRCNGFKAWHDQPACVDSDCEDEDVTWIDFGNTDNYQSEIYAGNLHVYFGSYTIEYNASGELYDCGSEFSIFKPLANAILDGFFGECVEFIKVPIKRDDIVWIEEDDYDEDGDLIDEHSYPDSFNREGFHYSKKDFNFDCPADSDIEALMGDMKYEVMDMEMFKRIVTEYKGKITA